jgi:hypothetical protein
MMPNMSPGAALRDLEQAQAGLRKARELVRQVREDPDSLTSAFDAGWESLCRAHRLMAAIPSTAADERVLTKHLAVGRYATALLVRLRRLRRNEADGGLGHSDHDDLAGDDDRED